MESERPVHPGPGGLSSRLFSWLRSGFALGIPALSFAFAMGLQRHLHLAIYDEQFLAALLGLALGLVFLAFPARSVSSESQAAVRVPPWYDAVAALAGLSTAVYVAIRYEYLVNESAFDPSVALVPGAVLLILAVEALRRVAGLALTVIVVLFAVYGLLGDWLPAPFTGRDISVERLVSQIALDPNGLLGRPLMIAATVVVAFVFFGLMLSRAGGALFFTDLAMVLMGRYRGGPAKIAVFASGLMGSISGSAVSNVVSTGVITIPLMRQGGYSARAAAAIEAVASTGGQMMPPIMGAAAFLMAEFLQVPYTSVILAALLPALLYYAALFIQVDLSAARQGIKAVPKHLIPLLGPTLRDGWFFPLPFAVLLIALFWLRLGVEEAALWSAALVVVLGFALGHAGRRLTLSDIVEGLRETGLVSLTILVIAAAAGIIIGVLNLTGLSFNLTLLLVQIGKGNLPLLLLIAAAASIVLGMGMPTVAVYVLLATLVAPSLVQVGIEPIAAHLFVLYFGMMSMITPPVAIAAFAAAGLARAPAMGTALSSMQLAWTAFIIPFLFVAAPSLLLIGPPMQIALASATAVGGVWLISAGVVGYFRTALDAIPRVLFVTAGMGLLVPAGVFQWAVLMDVAGALLGAALLIWQFVFARARPEPRPETGGPEEDGARSRAPVD